MWIDFFISCIYLVAILFVPSFLLLTTFFRNKVDCLAVSPCVSTAIYGIEAIIYPLIGIPTNWATIVLPSIIIGVLICLTTFIAKARTTRVKQAREPKAEKICDRNRWLMLCWYVLVGVVVVGFIFVKNLDGPAAFFRGHDSVFHFFHTRQFVNSGSWSSLEANGFYPSIWHELNALLITLLNVDIRIAANAVITVFLAFVFPAGVLYLMNKLFSENAKIIVFGGIATFSFGVLPWGLFSEVIYPFIAALCLTPATLALSIQVIQTIKAQSHDRLFSSIVVLVFCFASLCLTHTSLIFCIPIFLYPYCVHLILCSPDANNRRKTFLIFALSSLLLLIWTGFYLAPFMQGPINYNWPSFLSKSQALINLLGLSFQDEMSQIVLGAIIAIGIVSSCIKKKFRWLIFPYVFMGLLFIVCSTTDGCIKKFLTGFWYTDYLRIGPLTAFFGIPLVSIGLYSIYSFLYKKLCQINPSYRSSILQKTFFSVFMAIFIVINFYPSFELNGKGSVKTAFGYTNDVFKWQYDMSDVGRFYDKEEMQFIEETKKIVGNDVVINISPDGSAFAAGINDLNILFPNIDNSSSDKPAIKQKLDKLASDQEVQKEVEEAGAHYVLILDADNPDPSSRYSSYSKDDWIGIESINEETSGFEIVLSDGDMRLYKIERN